MLISDLRLGGWMRLKRDDFRSKRNDEVASELLKRADLRLKRTFGRSGRAPKEKTCRT